MKSNKGFSLTESFILFGVIILIAGVGVVGWKALTKSGAPDQASTVSTGQSAEVITTKADLEAAEKALGELDFEDDVEAQIEKQADL